VSAVLLLPILTAEVALDAVLDVALDPLEPLLLQALVDPEVLPERKGLVSLPPCALESKVNEPAPLWECWAMDAEVESLFSDDPDL
jgi:hypothetical protein